MAEKTSISTDSAKLTVVMTRVSTGSQSEEVQLELAKPYYEGVPESQLMFLSEHGVSANKVSFRKRPKLQQLLLLIKQGRVQTLILYNRDRLVRNYYEAIEVYPVLITHKVSVIFTASGAKAFGTWEQEALYAIFSQMEGQGIAARSRDAHQTYPPKLKGYSRVQGRDDKRVLYVPDETWSTTIQSLFEEATNIHTDKELLGIISAYARRLHVSSARILGILKTPFYAGLKRSGSSFIVLDHVTPIISSDTFMATNAMLDQYRSAVGYVEAVPVSIFNPICHLCGKPMNFRRRDISISGEYYCSRKHRKNAIQFDDLHDTIASVISDQLRKLNIPRLESECLRTIAAEQHRLVDGIKKLEGELDEATINIVIHGFSQTRQDTLSGLKVRINEQLGILTRVQNLRDDVETVIEQIRTILTRKSANSYDETLAKNLIHRITVDPNHITIELYFSEFYGGEDINDKAECK